MRPKHAKLQRKNSQAVVGIRPTASIDARGRRAIGAAVRTMLDFGIVGDFTRRRLEEIEGGYRCGAARYKLALREGLRRRLSSTPRQAVRP